MESKTDVETVEKVVRKLMEDEEFNAKTSSHRESFAATHEDKDAEKTGGRHRQLLSRLLSELESMEEDKDVTEEPKEEATSENPSSVERVNKVDGICSSSNEEIMKELKNVRRQNSITHCLLTTLIVVTVAWQFSEVSLILKIKNGLSNPFRSIGGIVKGIWKSRSGVMRHACDMQKQVTEQTSLKIPHLEFPGVERDHDNNNNN